LENVFNAIASLGLDPLYVFLAAVLLDDVLGVLQAVRTKTFNLSKLPSFLSSQLGTKEFLVVAGAAVAANSAGANVHQAALVIVVAGGGAMTLALVKDIYGKVVTLVTGK
jgi:hypothetical protein